MFGGSGSNRGQKDLRAGGDVMCVWDGTYTAPEDEREAMDQVPGWNDEAASIPQRRRAKAKESPREMRRTLTYLKAA
jgi:hypothetical protein